LYETEGQHGRKEKKGFTCGSRAEVKKANLKGKKGGGCWAKCGVETFCWHALHCTKGGMHCGRPVCALEFKQEEGPVERKLSLKKFP